MLAILSLGVTRLVTRLPILCNLAAIGRGAEQNTWFPLSIDRMAYCGPQSFVSPRSDK